MNKYSYIILCYEHLEARVNIVDVKYTINNIEQTAFANYEILDKLIKSDRTDNFRIIHNNKQYWLVSNKINKYGEPTLRISEKRVNG